LIEIPVDLFRNPVFDVLPRIAQILQRELFKDLFF
jgi:hypothetical protein